MEVFLFIIFCIILTTVLPLIAILYIIFGTYEYMKKIYRRIFKR